MAGRFIPLAEPIHYSGKVFDKILLSGHPFPGADSLYQRIRNEIIRSSGYPFLFEGDPRLSRLTSYTVENLKLEAYAYAVRAKYKGYVFTLTRDLKGAINDMDKFRGIFQLLKAQSRDPEIESNAELELQLSSVALKYLLADLSVESRNYVWASCLFEDASSILESCVKSQDYLAFCARGDKLVATNMFKDGLTKLTEGLKRRREDVEIERTRDAGPTQEWIPDPAIHPQSLKALHAESVAQECFIEAGQYHESIMEKELLVLSQEVNPYIAYVSGKLLMELVPHATETRFRADRVVLLASEKTAESEPWPGRLMLLVRGDAEAEKVFELYDKSLHQKLLGLLHSDPYVMMFGRFSSEIRTV